ncbi:MAG: integrase domain-containing protein, partial [Pseudomonadota bacterium]|nr:integrase domain-containing protein [Pseudomonadota bacterium]
ELKMMHAFGLRREEAVSIRPWRADYGDRLYVTEGTKGGRVRDVVISTAYQRQVLDEAKRMTASRRSHLSDLRYTQRQAIRHFSNTMAKYGLTRKGLGVTSHGLRHGWANDRCEQWGWVPPLRQQQEIVPVRLTVEQIRLRLAEELGHHRMGITSAYIGSPVVRRVALKKAIQEPEKAGKA